MVNKIELKPCPFCGFQVDRYGLDDVLYPNAIYWRRDKDLEKVYICHRDRRPDDNPCYELICNESMGGCGAEVHADSEQEAIDKWNSRA